MGSRDLWGFLAFSHGWTWLCWGVVVASGAHVWGEPWATAVFAIGGLGLPIGGVVMTWSVAGRDGLRDLGRRLVDPTRIAPRWWLVILGLYPAIKLVAGGCAVLFGSVDVPFELAETSALLRAPGELLAVMGFLLLLGPLPEEIGWRGFLLDRLQVRYRALTASLLLGLAWFAWHGPLFFITGYYDRAGGAPELLPFGAAIVLAAVLYTWIHNHTGRSVLAAVLFHFSGNLTGELLDAPTVVYRYELLLTAVVVLVVVWWWGGNTLSASVRDSTNAAPAEPPSTAARPNRSPPSSGTVVSDTDRISAIGAIQSVPGVVQYAPQKDVTGWKPDGSDRERGEGAPVFSAPEGCWST